MPVRKTAARLMMVVALAVASIGLVGTPAGAQASVTCTYTVSPTVLPPGGGVVTVSGNAVGSSVVRIFTDGRLRAVVPAAPVTGFFSADIFITASVELAVALDDYPFTPCTGTGGAGTGRGRSRFGALGRGGAFGANGLAGTGATDVGTYVIAGLGALAVGGVLVVAARRRREIRSRA